MIRVVLADDEQLIRTALATLVDLEDDVEVVGQAASGPEAVAVARQLQPDVAVLDLQMPGLDGIEVAAQLREQVPGCGVVIVTGHGRPGHLKRALATGVRGFLPKTTSAVTGHLVLYVVTATPNSKNSQAGQPVSTTATTWSGPFLGLFPTTP